MAKCVVFVVDVGMVLCSLVCPGADWTDKQAVLGASSYVGGRREGNKRETEEKGESKREREIDSQEKEKDGQGVCGLCWKEASGRVQERWRGVVKGKGADGREGQREKIKKDR